MIFFKKKVGVLETLILLAVLIDICACLKNCSYKDKETKKLKYNTCSDDMVCCENSYSMFDACCPNESFYVAPINLTLKNILFILCLFFGIIFSGALIISVMMGISSYLAQKDAKKRSSYRSAQLINYNNHVSCEYL